MDERERRLEHYLYWRLKCLEPETQLRGALLVDGDDAEEFFEHLEAEFGYSAWRENLYDFFQDEYSCGIWPRFKRLILNRKPDLLPLTLGDVVFCVLNNAPLQSFKNARIK